MAVVFFMAYKSFADMSDDELSDFIDGTLDRASRTGYRKVRPDDNVSIGYLDGKLSMVSIQDDASCSSRTISYDFWVELKADLGIDESTKDAYACIERYYDTLEGLPFSFPSPSPDGLAVRYY